MIRFSLAVLASVAAFTAAPVLAEGGRLTGDWGGARTSMEEMGLNANAVYKFDVMSNLDGGIDEGTVLLDNLDVTLDIDGEKLFGSKGTTALIHLLHNNGGIIDGGHVGSAQGIDNIEVEDDSGRLYQAWIQQNFLEDRLSLLAGLYDLNSEFYITDSSGLFIHSTFGIGTEIAQSGENGPSIFPVTSLAGRVRWQESDWYIQGAVLDAVPGDPDRIEGTQITVNGDEGALYVAELGFTPAENRKLAIGAWRYSERFDDLNQVDAFGNPLQRRSSGAYIIGEREICDNWVGFGRLGVASADINMFDAAWAAGVVNNGPFGREDAQLGLAFHGAHVSTEARDAVRAGGGRSDANEWGVELTYSDLLTDWLAVQPDVQYVVNPGADPALDNALILGSRFTIAF